MKIAYSLGGGGARGFAHIGVIKALHAANLKPDLITGTSMGSVIGAMYAQTTDPEIIISRVLNYIDSEDFKSMNLKVYRRNHRVDSFFGNALNRLEERLIINLSCSQLSLFKQEKFIKALDYYLDDGDFEDLKIPLGILAGDLNYGKKVVITSGDVKSAVLASSSIPGFLPPVDYNGYSLVDGEMVELIPTETARELGADLVIAVDVRQDLEENPVMENALDVFFRAVQIKSRLFSNMMDNADIVIKPQIGKFHWTEFERAGELIDLGYEAGLSQVDAIKRKIRRQRLKFWK